MKLFVNKVFKLSQNYAAHQFDL